MSVAHPSLFDMTDEWTCRFTYKHNSFIILPKDLIVVIICASHSLSIYIQQKYEQKQCIFVFAEVK